MTKNYQDFFKIINYQFNNIDLLDQALTHPSLINNHEKKISSYERLEFLGDKVLSLVIAEYLIEKFSLESEGLLSKRQANLVSGDTLSQIANKIDLPNYLKISRGEKKIGGNLNKNNLENAMEALIGAIYLDSNFFSVKKIILNLWQDFFNDNLTIKIDPISELQEIIQSKIKKPPIYFTEKKGGSDHQPIFLSRLTIQGLNHQSIFPEFIIPEFIAEGNSKKEAQKNVAKLALDFLKKL
jgi:ribonuclease-3